ncbi:hypothetical protein D3C76_935690 [compost metagenome]
MHLCLRIIAVQRVRHTPGPSQISAGFGMMGVIGYQIIVRHRRTIGQVIRISGRRILLQLDHFTVIRITDRTSDSGGIVGIHIIVSPEIRHMVMIYMRCGNIRRNMGCSSLANQQKSQQKGRNFASIPEMLQYLFSSSQYNDLLHY